MCVCECAFAVLIHFIAYISGQCLGKAKDVAPFPHPALNSPLLLASAQNGRMTAVISRRAGDLPWLRGGGR